jgi:hypothetical protein
MIHPNSSPEALYSYLEMLAVKHTDLKHSEKEQHYFRGEWADFYLSLVNRVKFPALISESFELHYNEEWKFREFTFIVVQDYDERNKYKTIDHAISVCEEIGEEIIRKIIHDTEQHDLGELDYGNGEPMENQEHKHIGIRFTVTLKSCFDTEINKKKWTK